MRRSKGAIAAFLTSIAMLAVVVAPASAGDTKAEQRARAAHERTIRYWTPERIASAKPRDFVRAPGGTFEPKAKPNRPPSGDGVVKGASWTGGGEVVKRTGKVYFTMGGSNYVCSAANLTDTRGDHSLVMTAAHCAYDETGRAFATNWTYIPSFDTAPTFTCSQTTYGCWTAKALVVHQGYASAGGFNTQATVHDFAVAVMRPGGKDGTTQLDTLGTYAAAYPAISVGGSVHAFGYPAAGKYRGKDLVYCAGPTFLDGYNANKTWGISCNMTGGSSGGPWIAGFTNSGSTSEKLTSLNSYGYSGLSNMYGPIFDDNTRDVVLAADAATTDTIVP